MSSADHVDNRNRRIDEELVAVDSLKHVLRARCGCTQVEIRREQHDPPDFTVTVDGETFPTEVTSIVSDQQYLAQCRRFANDIRKRAESLGVLSGEWALIVKRRPSIPKPTSKDGRQLLDAAIACLGAAPLPGPLAKVELAHDQWGSISIERLSATGSTIQLLLSPPSLWENEIQRQLGSLVQRAVDGKKSRLQNVVLRPRTTLLLLYDAFGYADPSDAIAAMQHVKGYDWFHSIFWAASFAERENAAYPEEHGREGIFLFSHNASWNRVGTIP